MMLSPMRNAALSLIAILASTGAGPAMALDCAKARTPIENAICADPAAAATDDAMTKAYDSLDERLSGPDKIALLTSQRRWLKRRDDICSGRDASGVGWCLADAAEKRDAFLSGEPDSGPGAAQVLTPVLIQHIGGPNQYDLDINAVKFADPQLPGEKIFNTKIDALLKQAPKIEQTDIRQNMVYSYDLNISATFVSPELASAHIEIYDFSGGAHGNSSTSNFAIDLVTGKELAFGDLFDAVARKPLETACLAQIAQQKHEKEPDRPFGVVSADAQKKVVEGSVGDLSRWSLFATGAKIDFDPYALGAYVEGSYTCDFPATLLRPLLKVNYLAEEAP